MLSRTARERERESSLSSVSSLKKSFTLIELSIVLLILSLLVGSLLVGRQIVDRAKIQRIIFEFDYYEKAFHQFYDTYRTVPGNLTEKNCYKYSEFYNIPKPKRYLVNGADYSAGWYCRTRPTENISRTIVDNLWKPHSFNQMYHAGTEIPNYAEELNMLCDFNANYRKSSQLNTAFNDYGGYRYGAYTSFDNKVYFSILGVNWQKINQQRFAKVAHCASNTLLNNTYMHEYENATLAKNINLHNILALTRDPSVTRCSSTSCKITAPTKSFGGALSAKLTSELDAKIDDGRPGTGKLIALKSGDARKSDTTQAKHEENCYVGTAENIHKTIYHSSTDLRYGCNIIKVMEDVK